MERQDITKITCLNCGNQTFGNYCHVCGQSTKTGRITFTETLGHFFSSAFAIDGPFSKTVRYLITQPGKVFREFIEGKRKSYYKPVGFFVLLTAIYILLRELIGYDALKGQLPQSGTNEQVRIAAEAGRFMYEHINNILFFLAIGIALMLKLFFRKVCNFTEYLSIGFYITGAYIFSGTVLMLVANYTGWQIHNLQLLLLLLYLVYCFHSFFQRKSVWPYIKYIIVAGLSLFTYLFLGYSFSFLIVYLEHLSK